MLTYHHGVYGGFQWVRCHLRPVFCLRLLLSSHFPEGGTGVCCTLCESHCYWKLFTVGGAALAGEGEPGPGLQAFLTALEDGVHLLTFIKSKPA